MCIWMRKTLGINVSVWPFVHGNANYANYLYTFVHEGFLPLTTHTDYLFKMVEWPSSFRIVTVLITALTTGCSVVWAIFPNIHRQYWGTQPSLCYFLLL